MRQLVASLLRDPRRSAAEDRERVALAHADRVFREAREELARADAKAQVLLGTVGVGLGAVAAGLLAGSWSPFDLSNAVEWLWWLGVAAAVVVLVCLSAAVYPRRGKPSAGDRGMVFYFDDALRFPAGQQLADALRDASTTALAGVADEIGRVSRIVALKYRLVRWGFWLSLLALTSTVTAVLVDAAL
ncbi:Pycsar system effector family protein [Microbispora sp. H13382]|uniref:Pycsar system effector family protein n=1 Tax=Microbispora sp. H13382 TaxID=2729112 RepID=UPI0015FF8B2D|nr:Pycsar system effector family protein [Microbispora sp. H13382]